MKYNAYILEMIILSGPCYFYAISSVLISKGMRVALLFFRVADLSVQFFFLFHTVLGKNYAK